MKTLFYLLTAVFLFIFTSGQSQELPKKQRFCFGGGIGIGFFYPVDVNDYISERLPDNYTPLFGIEGIFANYGLNLNLGYKIYRNWEFQLLGEAYMAPKFINVTYSNGDSEHHFYNFTRLSTGLLANFHIPLNAIGKHSIFFGAGPFLHAMGFEEYNAATIGARCLAGFSINNYKFNPQVYLSGDYASADDGNFNLNYSGVRIGVNLNF